MVLFYEEEVIQSQLIIPVNSTTGSGLTGLARPRSAPATSGLNHVVALI